MVPRRSVDRRGTATLSVVDRDNVDIVFVFRGDRRTLLKEVEQGSAPNEFLYGMPFVRAPGWRTDFVEDPRPFETLPERLLRPFQVWFGRRYTIGFNLHAYLKNAQRLRRADVIVTTADSYGLPVLWQRSRGTLRARIVYISQGLYPIARRAARHPFDRWVMRRIGGWLGHADSVVVFGEGDAEALRSSFGPWLPRDVDVIHFGIDEGFWRPAAEPRTGPILSVGSDPLRDYRTLMVAADDRPLRIVTRLPVPEAVGRANVLVDGNVNWIQLRALYHQASFVVVPVQNEPRNSGHSATLQAMSCGKAVILSDTPGLWDRSRMRHRETCYLVPPNDSGALRLAIDDLTRNPELADRIGASARALIEREWSAHAFGLGLRDRISSVLRSSAQRVGSGS